MLKQFKVALIGLIFVAYPVIIYALISSGLPWLGAAIVVGLLVWKFRHRSEKLLAITLLLLMVTAGGYMFGSAFISKMAPLLIHISLFYVFWGSLKTTPLITQFARLDFPELPPGIAEYCRKLTVIWSAFFAMNIIVCVALAIYDDHRIWTLYNGLIVYILIGALVVGEYLWRRIIFPDLEVPSLKQSIENIVKNGHQIWGKNDQKIERTG